MAKTVTIAPGEPKRDGYGRYLLRPPGDPKGKERAHTRVTTIASTIEDKYQLERWAERMVGLGLAKRPDLVLGISTVTDPTSPEGKKKVGQFTDEAKEFAGAHFKANVGTHLHELTHQLDRDLPVQAPEPYDADLTAYRSTMTKAGLGIIAVEQLVVRWGEYAGTFDRLVDYCGRTYVADIKTGSLDYSWGTIAMQMCLYADAETVYDLSTNTHLPMIKVETDLGIVIHLPAGEARCDLYWVDLDAGREAVQRAMWVRAWRKRKGIGERWVDDAPVDARPVRRARLAERVAALVASGHVGQLVSGWPASVPTLKRFSDHTTEQLDSIDSFLISLESKLGMPFGLPDPNSARKVGSEDGNDCEQEGS